jgi:hypothetical protein
MSVHIRANTFVLITALVLVPLSHPPRIKAQAAGPETFLQVRATASVNGAVIDWRVGSEPVLGFNVYRVKDGRRTQLNRSLIAGTVLTDRTRLQAYSWFDRAGTPAAEYHVEAIDLRGDAVIAGEANAGWNAVLPDVANTKLLSELGGPSTAAATPVSVANADEDGGKLQTAAALSPADALANQWSIAAQPALKIGVRLDGWYRITQTQMLAAGFDTTGDARNLRLFVSGNEIAMHVSRDTGPLGPADFIEFWGQGIDTPATDTQVYWLINGGQPGLRIAIKGELTIDANPAAQPDLLPTIATVSERFSPINLLSLINDRVRSPTVREGNGEVKALTVTEKSRHDLVLPPGSVIAPNVTIADAPKSVTENPRPTESARSNFAFAPAAPRFSRNPPPRVNSLKYSTRNTKLRSAKGGRRRQRTRRRHHVAAAAPAPAFTCSLQRKDHNIYYSAALNGERENFFGPVVFGDGPVVNVSVHNVEPSAAAPAQLQLALQGVSFETHQVKVFVNASLAGTISFVDETATTQTFAIPASWLVEGDNAVKLVPVGSSHDTSVLDYLRLTYPHSFRADSDALQFSLRSDQSARVEGFTTANLRVLDISDPASVQEVRPIIEAAGGGFAATIPSAGHGKARRLIALPADRLSPPAWLTLNQPSTLNLSSNAATLIIISHKDFLPALATLVAQRQAQGYTVAVANVEDVFDEFGFGVHTPQAIKDFMSRARSSWSTGPNYLLLVGDASYDPRNYLGVGNFDLVPTRQVDTGIAGTATALETASDDWLTDFNGDGIADISVGRLPARTPAEANLMIGKTVNYSPANTAQSAMLVADTQGSYYFNFESASDQVGALLPANMTVQKVYRRLQPSDAIAHDNIIAKFNAGQALAVYSGHGNVNIWGGQIFTANDAVALTNGNRLPFVVVMDCLNGLFDDPSLQSLAEALLQAPNGGAVASFASSGLTIPDGQHEMGLRMFQLLYSGAPIPIGDASRQAKTATNDRDVRRTWILLGDPTLKIR